MTYLDLTYTLGVMHKTPVLRRQLGGNPLAIVAAAHAFAKAVKPFTRLKKVLEDNVKNKNHPLYKAAHKVTEVGSSAGYGKHKKRKHTKKTHKKK